MSAVAAPVKSVWASVNVPVPKQSEPEEDIFESKIETIIDPSGLKIVTEFRLNERGQRVKIVQRIRTVTRKVKKSQKVEERQSWKKFGDASIVVGDSSISYLSNEDVFLEVKKRVDDEEKQVDPSEKITSTSGMVVCRLCGAVGDHIFLKCPKRRLMGDSAVDAKLSSAVAAAAEELPKAGEKGKYVPPSRRLGGAATDPTHPSNRDREREEKPTVRVTNLSEEETEDDLRALFERFGYIHRVFLGRDRDTNKPKGYAYVAFDDPANAQLAIDKLNGYGYNSLILHVDWADKRK